MSCEYYCSECGLPIIPKVKVVRWVDVTDECKADVHPNGYVKLIHNGITVMSFGLGTPYFHTTNTKDYKVVKRMHIIPGCYSNFKILKKML